MIPLDRIEFRVAAGEAGERLDRYLASRLPDTSRSTIQKWIAAGSVRVQGRPERAKYPIHPDDRIEIFRPPPEPVEVVPEAIPLDILYEDSDLVVVDKPSGLVVHPGAGRPRGTLVNALVHHFSEINRPGTLRPGIVHRLDKDTSGVLVVAKNERIHELLARQFKHREVDKAYLALVYGCPKEDRGEIDVPIGRDARIRTRISTRTRRARAARTEWEVVRRYPEFALLRIRLHTGRTHQIRVHLQHQGHPVVGDQTYGKGSLSRIRDRDQIRRIQQLSRHFLHAERLSFRHPATGQRLTFESPLPPELADFLTGLE